MKGVIVAAGYGTRFLPLTKTMPKEMLPLWDKPLIDFILDEFEEAGIRDIVVITSRRKAALENYLDREAELESVFGKEGRTDLLDKIKTRKMNFVFIRQQEMKGTGHALLLTKPVIGNDAFVVAYPDDIVLSRNGEPGLSAQLVQHFNQHGKNILAVRTEKENISRYGVIQPREKDGMTLVEKIVEKPSAKDAPSDMVSVGRYLFTPELLDLLEKGYRNHTKGEFYHIDAINQLASQEKVAAFRTQGIVLDTGESDSYLQSILLYAGRSPKGSKIIDAFIKNDLGK
jgi:UTP--glucose-1-phosphate uridylyltransferase